MTTVRTGTLLGWTREVDGSGMVHVEDVYATDIEDLWAAVTEPERLARWLAEVSGDLRVGGTFAARFTSSWEGPGRVEVCERPHRLLLTMQPETGEETQIEALLTAESEGTRLVVEERGFPPGVAPDHGAGWQAHLEDLGASLESREAVPWEERWHQLIPAYRPESA
jgi:uncharacterized protein YndB with AHSA1/START domain